MAVTVSCACAVHVRLVVTDRKPITGSGSVITTLLVEMSQLKPSITVMLYVPAPRPVNAGLDCAALEAISVVPSASYMFSTYW